MPFWNRDPKPRTYVMGKATKNVPDYIEESLRGKSRRITEIGEPVLHNRAENVAESEFGSLELQELIDDMFTTMDIAEGVGLAAPQIGVNKQVFVFDVPDDAENRHVGHVVNPKLTIHDDGEPQTRGEGCLSVPGAYADLERPHRVTVTGFDWKGEPLTLEGEGYLARAFIHEYQHLQGTLYWDHLSDSEQERALAQRDLERPRVIERRKAVAAELGKQHPEYPATPAGGR
jgi:peptide deformylase